MQATGDLNVLVNYWSSPDGRPINAQPLPALVHAMLAFRDLPEPVRTAWKAWFDHYVFGEGAARAGEHLSLHARGPLAPFTPDAAQETRRHIASRLR